MTYSQRVSRRVRLNRAERRRVRATGSADRPEEARVPTAMDRLLLLAARLCARHQLELTPVELIEQESARLSLNGEPISVDDLLARLRATVSQRVGDP